MTVIDAHLHVWRGVANHPTPSMTPVSPASDVPLELFEQYMNEYAIERAVLVQPLYPGEDNSYIAECAARNPARFAAVCVVDPRSPGAEERLEYWVLRRGCKGLRLRPRVSAESEILASPQILPLWQRADTLRIVVSILGSPEHLPLIAAAAERFPSLRIILDHIAHPAVEDGVRGERFRKLLEMARYPHIYLKMSGYYYFSRERYPFRDCHPLIHALYEHYGAERLIWGSDFPHVLLKTGYQRSLRFLQRTFSFLTESDLNRIMRENAAALYWN